MGGLGNELTTKFVKAHIVNQSLSTQNALRWLHKLIYEFWGFCINGDNNLLVPRGFAPVSGVLFPVGWQSGSAVLIASGSDGQTQDGMPFFTAPSVNWTSGTMVSRWLVTWKSGSTSTDDGIYPIIQVINSSTIRLDCNTGGTPYSGNLHPSMTARSGINFRVVDFAAATNLAGFTADADGLVLCLSGAYLVNSGQVTPQCRTRIRTSVGSNVPQTGLTLSSSGSWTPASSSGFFTDNSAEINANTNAAGWFNGSAGTGCITLMGAQDFLMVHIKGTNWTNGSAGTASGFHLEVPQRLYPQNNDPNPIVAMNYGVFGLTITSTTDNYGGGFQAFHPPDGTTRKWRGMLRPMSGDYWASMQYVAGTNTPSAVSNGRYNELYFNLFKNKFMMNDFMLGNDFGIGTGGYAAARMKLRRVRWTANIIPTFQRLGDHGEWIHVQNGILWPWDGSILPYNLFQSGT